MQIKKSPAKVQQREDNIYNISATAVKSAPWKESENFPKIMLDIWELPCYIEAKQGRNGSPTNPIQKGGGNMEVSEILSLLTLLAVVIFGIIDIMKK